MSQAEIQGIFNARVDHINEFRRVMGDIRIENHPNSQNILVIFNTKLIDEYADVTHNRDPLFLPVSKRVLVTKHNVIEYVQQEFTDYLVESEFDMPWLVTLTSTGLPRPVQADDQLLIANVLYTVAHVKVHVRTMDSVQVLLIYNERGNMSEPDVNDTDDDYFYDNPHPVYPPRDPLLP